MSKQLRLSNFEQLIMQIKELDEQPDAVGFVLVGKNDKKTTKFSVSVKRFHPQTIIAALEQYKHMYYAKISQGATYDKQV